MKYILYLGLGFLIVSQTFALDFSHISKISRMDAGKSLPDLSLPTLDGTRLDLGSLTGRVVLVNFWATWCGPCKEEMPSLERLRKKFAPHQLQILAVTTDIRPQDIKAFWAQLGLHFPVLLDEQEDLSQSLMVRNLPTTILVDTQGKIHDRVMGPREWDSPESVAVVQSLLSNP